MANNYDLAVVGSGFAGSLMAMIGRRLGRSVVLIEKGKHPRTVIGESSTPLTNLLLEELASRYDLPGVKPLAKWGSWQRSYPQIGCGLKRGFTFYHHDLSSPGRSLPDRARQLLVAASPNDEMADTHWYRADLDHFLVSQAQSLGVDYLDETRLTSLTHSENGVELGGHRHGNRVELRAKFLIDASGPRGFLHRKLGLRETALPDYPDTQALYSHFTGVDRLDRLTPDPDPDEPPYPVDDAAVHHVFDGGWIWVLRFNNGITSAGIAASGRVAIGLNFAQGEQAWRRALQGLPLLGKQFAGSASIQPFTHLSRLSFRSPAVAGAGWAMLPSAAGFVDPLLSTGFPLTLSGVARLAAILDEHWESPAFGTYLDKYAEETQAELLAASRLIAALYANMHDFPVFSAICLIYFAAVSYAEATRRLGKTHLQRGFLLHDHPVLGPAIEESLRRCQVPRQSEASAMLVADIHKMIEPWNVAGFGDRCRANWYPVDAADLLCAASKLDSSQDEIRSMLERCGFALPVPIS